MTRKVKQLSDLSMPEQVLLFEHFVEDSQFIDDPRTIVECVYHIEENGQVVPITYFRRELDEILEEEEMTEMIGYFIPRGLSLFEEIPIHALAIVCDSKTGDAKESSTGLSENEAKQLKQFAVDAYHYLGNRYWGTN